MVKERLDWQNALRTRPHKYRGFNDALLHKIKLAAHHPGHETASGRRKRKVAAIPLLLLAAALVIWGTEWLTEQSPRQAGQASLAQIEEAIAKTSIRYDEILHVSSHDGNTFIFYRLEDVISVGLMEPAKFGAYRWVKGSGSKMLGEQAFYSDDSVTTSPHIANLAIHNRQVDSYFSISFGYLLQPARKVDVQFKDQPPQEAVLIPFDSGQLWYALPEQPINADPLVRIVE